MWVWAKLSKEESMSPLFKQFYKQSLSQRLKALEKTGYLDPDQAGKLQSGDLKLSHEVGDHMIENYIGSYTLPMGLALHFLLDGKNYLVPMAIEEPSVIAAASNGAKMVGQSGGFHTVKENRLMVGQVVIAGSPKPSQDRKKILSHQQALIDLANTSYPSIVKRGGGARGIQVKQFDPEPGQDIGSYLAIYLAVDCQEAMGANIINTMLEALAPEIDHLTSGHVLMSILSNLATESLVSVSSQIDPKFLAKGNMTGEAVRDRIIQAYQYACLDPYRAATHNKGIMNGVDGLVLASGNDWRAIEAGAHAYASLTGHYRPLSKWEKTQDGQLKGTITLPLPIATVGGAIASHPVAQVSQQILGQPTAKELARLIAAVGLAQNLSALRALVTTGIQEGHMALQARSLAMSAGARGDKIQKLADRLVDQDQMNLATARALLKNMEKD